MIREEHHTDTETESVPSAHLGKISFVLFFFFPSAPRTRRVHGTELSSSCPGCRSTNTWSYLAHRVEISAWNILARLTPLTHGFSDDHIGEMCSPLRGVWPEARVNTSTGEVSHRLMCFLWDLGFRPKSKICVDKSELLVGVKACVKQSVCSVFPRIHSWSAATFRMNEQ